MIIKELISFYRRNFKISLLMYVQITFFMVLISCFYSFLYDLDFEKNDMKKIYSGKAIYQIIDNYVNGDDYDKFINENDSLAKLKEFYNGLEKAQSFEYVTVADQHILLDNLNIEDRFVYGYENGKEIPIITMDDKYYKPVKSIQMNLKCAQYFNLKISDGSMWNENDFYCKEIMPILMGSSYKKIYKVGDIIHINYLNKNIKCIISGFLEESSKIYYMEQPEFYLDDYIIMPMINYDEPLSSTEENYQIMNYFNMVNGYLVIDNKKDSVYNMMKEVENIALTTGFDGYSFIGLNPHIKKYDDMINVLDENETLITLILKISCFLHILVILLLSFLQYEKEKFYYYCYIMQGASSYFIIMLKTFEIALIVGLSGATQIFILNSLMKIGEAASYMEAVKFGILIIISYVLLGSNLLLKNTELAMNRGE